MWTMLVGRAAKWWPLLRKVAPLLIVLALVFGTGWAFQRAWDKRIEAVRVAAIEATKAEFAARDQAALEALRKQIAEQEQAARATDAALAEALTGLRASRDRQLRELGNAIDKARAGDCGPLRERLRNTGRVQPAFDSCFAAGPGGTGPGSVLPAGPASPGAAGAG